MTRSIGSGTGPPGSRPTWTCRPRRRRQVTESAATAGEPSASIETCAPPPVISPMAVGRAAGTRVHGRFRAELAGPRPRRGGDVDGQHARAQGRADHHRGQPHPAAAVHGQPVPGPHPAVRGDGAERGGEPAAQAGRGDEVQAAGQRHQVGVGRVHGHELGERARPGEPRLGLPRAHLGVTGQAVLAPAAAAGERHRHPVPGAPSPYLGPCRHDHPGELVPADVRQCHRIVALPGVPVRPAHPGRADRDDHPVGGAGRVGRLRQHRGGPVAGVDDRLHEALAPDESSSMLLTLPGSVGPHAARRVGRRLRRACRKQPEVRRTGRRRRRPG